MRYILGTSGRGSVRESTKPSKSPLLSVGDVKIHRVDASDNNIHTHINIMPCTLIYAQYHVHPIRGAL